MPAQFRPRFGDDTEAALAGRMQPSDKKNNLDPCICSVCLNPAFENTVVTRCDHVFHQGCIDDALQLRRVCPNCRDPLPAGQQCFKEVPRPFRQILRITKVRCPQQGCAKEMQFDLLRPHLHDACPQTDFVCLSEGCGEVMWRHQTQAHSLQCEHAAVLCDCGQTMKRRALQEHKERECPRRRVPCEHNCGAQDIVYCEMEQHLSRCMGAAHAKQISELKGTIEQHRQVRERQWRLCIVLVLLSCIISVQQCWMQQQKEAVHKQLAEKTAQLEQQMTEKTAQLEQQMTEKTAQLEQQMTEKTAQLKRADVQHQRSMQQQMEAVEKQLTEKTAQLEQQIGDEAAQLKQTDVQHQRAMQQSDKRLQQQLDAQKSDIAALGKTVNTDHRKMLLQQQRGIEDLTEGQKKQAAAGKAALKEGRKNREQMIKALTESKGKLREALQAHAMGVPESLVVKYEERAIVDGTYWLLPERHNGAAVWGKGEYRVFKNKHRNWMITDARSDLQDEKGFLNIRTLTDKSAPLASEGWLANTGPAGKPWQPAPGTSVTAAP